MPRLIWVFPGRIVTLLVLSCCSSFGNNVFLSVVDCKKYFLNNSCNTAVENCNCRTEETLTHVPKNPPILINWKGPCSILGVSGLVWFLFYGPSTHFRSFRARSVNLVVVYFFIFILFRIDIPVSKQWRPWSDAAFCGVWSGSALSAFVPKMGCQAYIG